ncbi:hypothetical protein GGU11DRAFT_854030 [Lentinula aff. detonsa]|nr:hypothetical protein GGU11DRAFT_854030 [Lentinula aff. detonsa]
MAIENFLSGRCSHHPGEIIHNWFTSPDGRTGANEEAKDQMWSTGSPKYWEIRNIRACLTSFAAQTSICHAVKQAKTAVRPDRGLHVRLARKSESGSQENPVDMYWKDIGVDTVRRVSKILRTNEPFLVDFLSCVATGKTDNKFIVTRKSRPVDMVITHCISALNFCLNQRANWLPVARGILYFAHSAPVDLFAYESRIGTMPAYSTIYGILRELGCYEAIASETAGRDPAQWGKLFIDNVQNYLRQRDMRAGREHKMSIGLAGTYIQYPPGTFDTTAPDPADRKSRIAKNERAHLTTDFFVDLINHEHLETVGSIQWLESLFSQVPQLRHYLPHVALLYETRAAINRVSSEPSKIHPLSTNGRNENVTAEFYAAVLDFFRQVGQTKDQFLHRLCPLGGDGLTFQRLHELKRYLQYNDNELSSLAIVEPQLEWWHTMWTDLCRIFETHWGEPLSKDPSTLGHSSRKIGRDDPSNLKKVDYYPGAQLAYLVLDVRMLDCWRLVFDTPDIFKYFQTLQSKNQIPPIEEFEKTARKLFRSYSSTRGMYNSIHHADLPKESSEWTNNVPMGTPWTGVTDIPTSDIGLTSIRSGASRKAKQPEKKKKKHTKAQKQAEIEREENRKHGDHVLANSISFMRDTVLSRECANAVASGDVGRVWEVLKVMLFTFAGSSHSKYATYLLETVTTLELESSTNLRNALLRMMVVNLGGKAGAFAPCDLIQEYFNRLLEMIVERKGKEFNDVFIQEVISRNLHNLARVKSDLRRGVDLENHSGCHSEPHNNAETRILLQQYADHELHSRRPGRFIEERDTDDFQRGWNKLRKGKLAKWTEETTRSRVREDLESRITTLGSAMMVEQTLANNCSTFCSPASYSDSDSSSESEEDSDASESDNEEDWGFKNSLGVMEVINGCLISQTLDLEQTADEAMAFLEAEWRRNEQETWGDDQSDNESMEDE